MRKNFQLRNALMLMGLASMPLWFASCSDEENIPAPGTDEPTNPEIEAAFDFKMTKTLPVKVDYPAFAQICVYDQVPDGTNNARLLFKSFTGANGSLESAYTFPTAYIGKTVYVVANGYNCPPVQEATLTENGLEIKAESSRRAVSITSEYSRQEIENFWAATLSVLPEDGDNLEYVKENYTSGVNIDTHISGLNEQYPTAQINVTFVNMVADNYNTLYYYTYTEETKNQINDAWIKRQMTEDHKLFGPYSSTDTGWWGSEGKNHPNRHINDAVTICDSDGTPIEFKNGDYIGFILVSSASENGRNPQIFYTSEESTEERVGQAASFSYQRRALVYTFEDQPVYDNRGNYNKSDFNDFCFVVTANPHEAIDNPDIPDLPTPPFYLEERQAALEGTLLFEDNYPEAGDYDMNDFVTTYSLTPVTYVLYYPDSGTEVEPYYLGAVEYSFTPKWDGAWYGCSFSFMLDGLKNDPTHVYTMNANQTMGALSVEPITGTIDLGFSSEGMTITSSNTYDIAAYPLGEIFNPFIQPTSNNREVHLPDYAPSAGANLEGLTEWQKAYKLEDGKHPFAANVPTLDYQIVTEQMKIDDFYPQYIDWVNSDGTTNTDWYLHPAQ